MFQVGECFLFFATTLLFVFCYITLLFMLINKFTAGGEKVPRTPVVFKKAIPLRKKKASMILSVQASYVINNILLQIYYYVIISFNENIPKTSANAAHVLQCIEGRPSQPGLP